MTSLRWVRPSVALFLILLSINYIVKQSKTVRLRQFTVGIKGIECPTNIVMIVIAATIYTKSILFTIPKSVLLLLISFAPADMVCYMFLPLQVHLMTVLVAFPHAIYLHRCKSPVLLLSLFCSFDT